MICNLLLSYLNVQIIPDYSSDSSFKLLFFSYASLTLRAFFFLSVLDLGGCMGSSLVVEIRGHW